MFATDRDTVFATETVLNPLLYNFGFSYTQNTTNSLFIILKREREWELKKDGESRAELL
jgi:hypothetical protein